MAYNRIRLSKPTSKTIFRVVREFEFDSAPVCINLPNLTMSGEGNICGKPQPSQRVWYLRRITTDCDASRYIRTFEVNCWAVWNQCTITLQNIACFACHSMKDPWWTTTLSVSYGVNTHRQSLNVDDYPSLLQFCRWFHSGVLFMDEAQLARISLIMNTDNEYRWVSTHAIRQSRHQQIFSCNVFAGIVGDHLFVPKSLSYTSSGCSYGRFSE